MHPNPYNHATNSPRLGSVGGNTLLTLIISRLAGSETELVVVTANSELFLFKIDDILADNVSSLSMKHTNKRPLRMAP